jgi:hypothetical protein
VGGTPTLQRSLVSWVPSTFFFATRGHSPSSGASFPASAVGYCRWRGHRLRSGIRRIRPHLDPVGFTLARQLEDLAYGASRDSRSLALLGRIGGHPHVDTCATPPRSWGRE